SAPNSQSYFKREPLPTRRASASCALLVSQSASSGPLSPCTLCASSSPLRGRMVLLVHTGGFCIFRAKRL
ncbi:unnamed protein product, partial [Symbiodinium pilosum]